MKKVITATTAADTSNTLQVPNGHYASIAQTGLAGIEVITLDIDLNGTWTPILPAIELSATANYIQVAGPAAYRINKPTTAGAVAVFTDE